jgi:hypothetical protein
MIKGVQVVFSLGWRILYRRQDGEWPMTTASMSKPIIHDKDGNPLSLYPGSGKPAAFAEMEAEWDEIRRRFHHVLKKVSLDGFLAEKHAEAERL